MRKPYQSPGRMKNLSYYIAPVGVRTHDLPHTVASNMVKVSHALNHSATEGQLSLSQCRKKIVMLLGGPFHSGAPRPCLPCLPSRDAAAWLMAKGKRGRERCEQKQTQTVVSPSGREASISFVICSTLGATIELSNQSKVDLQKRKLPPEFEDNGGCEASE